MNSVTGGNATVGTVSSSGLYTAPSSVPSGGSATVTALSSYDAAASASATVSITGGGDTTALEREQHLERLELHADSLRKRIG